MDKNISFKIEGNTILEKYIDIWKKKKKKKKILGMKFHVNPVYEEKYIKTNVRVFNGIVNTIFWNDKIPKKKKNIQYTCIAEINIDSVMKMDQKNYPQVHLKESKCEINKNKMVRFINAE